MAGTFPGNSSHGSDFNYDFHVSFDESRAAIEYKYIDKAEIERPAADRRVGPSRRSATA